MTPTPSELFEKMRSQRDGRLPRFFQYLGNIDPEFLDAYNQLAVLNFNYAEAEAGRALQSKVKELIAIALLASVRGNTTRHHIRRALELGATRREIIESLEMAMHITGAPSMEFGLSEMMALDAET